MNTHSIPEKPQQDASQAESIKTRLLLVNIHPIFDRSLASLIEPLSDLMVCGQVTDACNTFQIIEVAHPDLILADLFMENPQDVVLLKGLQAQHPGLPVIILSTHDEMLYAERALHSGVRGYVMIGEPVEYIFGAIREVLRGGLAFSHNVTQRLLQRNIQYPMDQGVRPIDRLTGREKEILELIGQGISTRIIGEKLQISIKTVQAHRENIKEKLEIKDGLSLTLFAVHWLESENHARQTRSDRFGKTTSSLSR
jgi:DNA-binding NarL/FixJ family response regulator